MSSSKHRLVISNNGLMHKVELDGTDISMALYSLDIQLRPDELPTATLEVTADDIEIDESVQVHIAPQSATLLKSLGWNPPQEDGGQSKVQR